MVFLVVDKMHQISIGIDDYFGILLSLVCTVICGSVLRVSSRVGVYFEQSLT